jgi:hypothetical protein
MRRLLVLITLAITALAVVATVNVARERREAIAVNCDPSEESTPEFSKLFTRIFEEAGKIDSYVVEANLSARTSGNPPHLLSRSFTHRDEREQVYVQALTRYSAEDESRFEIYTDEANGVSFFRRPGEAWQQKANMDNSAQTESQARWRCQPSVEKLLPLVYGDAPGLLRIQSVYSSRNADTGDLTLDSYFDKATLRPAKKVLNWTRLVVYDDGVEVTWNYHQECEFSAFNVPLVLPPDLPAYERVGVVSLE